MKKTIITALMCLALVSAMPTAAYAMELMVGGQPVGIQLNTDGVMVAGLASIETAEGKKYRFCGICGHFSAMDLIFSAAMLYWIS